MRSPENPPEGRRNPSLECALGRLTEKRCKEKAEENRDSGERKEKRERKRKKDPAESLEEEEEGERKNPAEEGEDEGDKKEGEEKRKEEKARTPLFGRGVSIGPAGRVAWDGLGTGKGGELYDGGICTLDRRYLVQGRRGVGILP